MEHNKLTLRTLGITRRAALPETERAAVAFSVAAMLYSSLPVAAKIIAGYYPIRDELDARIALRMQVNQRQLCLPVVKQGSKVLEFRTWKPDTPMEKGFYGIPCPVEGSEILSPDVVLVPLAAFDARKHRIGYGAGYYDATLAALRQQNQAVIAIGVAYACQEVPEIPDSPQDIVLDMIITEKGMFA